MYRPSPHIDSHFPAVYKAVVRREWGALRDAYLAAGVVPAKARNDAEHVAAATVADVDVIVSWNFRHIVQLERIRGFHGVGLLHGYRAVSIHSPREVVEL